MRASNGILCHQVYGAAVQMIRLLRVAIVLLSLNTCSSWARLGAQYQMELGNPSEATTGPSNKSNTPWEVLRESIIATNYN